MTPSPAPTPMMPLLYLMTLPLQTAPVPAESVGTGLEWMTIASVVIPAVLLIVLIYLGTRRTV